MASRNFVVYFSDLGYPITAKLSDVVRKLDGLVVARIRSCYVPEGCNLHPGWHYGILLSFRNPRSIQRSDLIVHYEDSSEAEPSDVDTVRPGVRVDDILYHDDKGEEIVIRP